MLIPTVEKRPLFLSRLITNILSAAPASENAAAVMLPNRLFTTIILTRLTNAALVSPYLMSTKSMTQLASPSFIPGSSPGITIKLSMYPIIIATAVNIPQKATLLISVFFTVPPRHIRSFPL